MSIDLNAKAAYIKRGFRNFNVHRWTFQVDGITRHMYGVTLFGFCVDVSKMRSS